MLPQRGDSVRNKVLSVKNGNYKIVDKTNVLDDRIRSKNHLCFNCDNGYPSLCEKMELQKYYLAHYDFIKEGYQVIGDKGEITRFVITECDNYINTKTPIRTENVRTMKRR